MKHEIINIQGMHCNSCVKKIEFNLQQTDGISNTKVSLAKDQAEITYNPEKITLNQIKSKINELGYTTDTNTKTKPQKKDNTLAKGLLYGIIPHIGCIAFVFGSIFGVTFLMDYFKPLLMSRYFFHALIGISFLFATLSSIIYLRQNGLLSANGIKKKWRYLSIMYGSTIGVNLLLFLLIFPMLANVSVEATADIHSTTQTALLKLQVDIPCSGHAPLISEELKTIAGVQNVKFSFPNNFDVDYNPDQTSKEQMLELEVFNSYPATIIGDFTN